MSRVGAKPIALPKGVKVDINGQTVKAKGTKGEVNFDVHPRINVAVEEDKLVVKRGGNERTDRALHGLTRALLNNVLIGVSAGFEKKIEIVGVGYQADVQGKKLKLTVGFAKPVELTIPDDVTVTATDSTHLTISGVDKQRVGQFAAEIRSVRKPEPYKGTGIKYQDEQIRRKAGKAFGSAG